MSRWGGGRIQETGDRIQETGVPAFCALLLVTVVCFVLAIEKEGDAAASWSQGSTLDLLSPVFCLLSPFRGYGWFLPSALQ